MTRLIALAKIVRVHGFPRDGITTYKADLYNSGGLLFKNRKEIYLPEPAELARETSPHGGAWGQAKGVLLPLALPDLVGREVSLPREDFPKLERGAYVCDLLGLEVVDENGDSHGTVVGFDDVAPHLGGAVNLRVKGAKAFEFPSHWIDFERSNAQKLCVPEVKEWIE